MKVCLKCGATDRNPSGKCVPCQKAYNAAYRRANAKDLKVRDAAYYLENQRKIKDRSARYYADNKERVARTGALRYADNKGRVARTGAAYRASNTEKIKIKKAVYRLENPERVAAAGAANYAANPNRVKDAARIWRKNNPDKRRVHAQNRRSREQGGRLSPDLVLSLYISQEGKCACCGQPLRDTYHLDHIMPLALGGANTDDNVQLLLPRCNMRKSSKHPDVWLTQRVKVDTVRA